MAKKKDSTGTAAGRVSTTTMTQSPHAGLDERQLLRISRAIADPRRMTLLRRIAQKSSSCADLRECLSISPATLSHHMKQLETAGLITTSKDGRNVSATLQKKVWKTYIGALRSIGD